MKLRYKYIFLLFIIFIIVASCNKDDENGVIIVPERDRAEVAAEDDIKIREYLQTHFYNYEDFLNPTEGFDYQIVFDTIASNNMNKTPLLEQVQSRVMKIRDSDNNLVDHTLYYLVVREGAGEPTTVADSIFLSFKGSLLNNVTFDARLNPLWQDLLGTRSIPGVLSGYREAITSFKPSAGEPILNDDGTFSFENDYGIGAFFLPSGIAYWLNPPSGSGIPVYSPLVFRINMFIAKRADHDRDGVLSIDEIEYDENTGVIEFPDSNGNGTPDYLDPTYPNN